MYLEAFVLCGRAHPRARWQWSWCWESRSRITSLLSLVIGCWSTSPSPASFSITEWGAPQITLITIIFIFDLKKQTLFSWVCVFCCHCAGGSFREWPRARQIRRARRLSLRANTSSLMECGCRPSAEGRWRRSPTSRSEVATFGLSPTQSQVNTPLRHCSPRRRISWQLAALCRGWCRWSPPPQPPSISLRCTNKARLAFLYMHHPSARVHVAWRACNCNCKSGRLDRAGWVTAIWLVCVYIALVRRNYI